jgi:hypothetical protein
MQYFVIRTSADIFAIFRMPSSSNLNPLVVLKQASSYYYRMFMDPKCLGYFCDILKDARGGMSVAPN